MQSFLRIQAGRLFFLILLLCGCGSSSGEGGSGAYQANLVFPEDIPRIEGRSEIDCTAAGIATIRFNFIVEEQLNSSRIFKCEDHNAHISDPPIGTGIMVEVLAEDADDYILLMGSAIVDILRGQGKTGGEIQMQYVPSDMSTSDTSTSDTSTSDTSTSDTSTSDTSTSDTSTPDTSTPDTSTPDRFINSFGMEFVRIQAGTFLMGSPEEELGRDIGEIQHQVTLTQDFYMQITELTQGQWRDVVQRANITNLLSPNPSAFPNCGDNCPVENVSWDDIQQFIGALNQLDEGTYALPTEAQWEFAARGNTTTALPTGDLNGELPIDDCFSYTQTRLDSIAWYCNNSDVDSYLGCYRMMDRCMGPHPVAQKAPNPFGLYDMHGNVYEWCQDLHGDYPTTAQIDPTGSTVGTRRVLRGGCWYYPAQDCRSARRYFANPGQLTNYNGFRLVCRQPSQP